MTCTTGNRRIYATVELDGDNTTANNNASVVDRITSVHDVYDKQIFASGQVHIDELSTKAKHYLEEKIAVVAVGAIVVGGAIAGPIGVAIAGHGFMASAAAGAIAYSILEHPQDMKRFFPTEKKWLAWKHWAEKIGHQNITQPFEINTAHHIIDTNIH